MNDTAHKVTDFDNPWIRCIECEAKATGFHDQDCDCGGDYYLVPCGHPDGHFSACPTWSKEEGCRCRNP
jgi:hypothetical protein